MVRKGYCAFCGKRVSVNTIGNTYIHAEPADVGQKSTRVCPGSREVALKHSPVRPPGPLSCGCVNGCEMKSK